MIKKAVRTALVIACLFLAACHPKPLDIKIGQQERALAVSSAAVDLHTVFVAAGYSVTSLNNLLDTAGGKAAGAGLMVDSGLVILSTPGRPADTLPRTPSGLYGRKDLQLQPGAVYTLFVQDLRTGEQTTANTRFFNQHKPDTLLAKVVRRPQDTMVRLHVCLSGVAADDYFFLHYATPSSGKAALTPWAFNASVLSSFTPKRIELMAGSEAVNGTLTREFAASVKGNDTVYAQLSRIDKPYYDYLTAYKKSGNLMSQLTGEPINLPSNLSTGFGFFSLFIPERKVFVLNSY